MSTLKGVVNNTGEDACEACNMVTGTNQGFNKCQGSVLLLNILKIGKHLFHFCFIIAKIKYHLIFFLNQLLFETPLEKKKYARYFQDQHMGLPCPYAIFVGTQYSKATISCPHLCSTVKEKNPDFKKCIVGWLQMSLNQKHS